MAKGICSWKGCEKPNMGTRRYCLEHHAEYSRNWRKTHKLTGEAKFKDTSRHIAGVYKRRGILEPLPCETCGTTKKVEMHHIDYHYPLIVGWLCRPCHLAEHKTTKAEAA